MISAGTSNAVNAMSLTSNNLPGTVASSHSQIQTLEINIKPLLDDFPLHNLKNLHNFRELKPNKHNDFSHKIQLAEDKMGNTWVVKRTMKVNQRELKRDKEKEKTAREVFFGEVARFLDPHLPEYRTGVDDHGNYYVLSKLANFRSFNQIYAEEASLKQQTDFRTLIHKGQLRGAARTGIINFLVIENDGGLHNVGLFQKPVIAEIESKECPYVADNNYTFVIGQVDRGQTGERAYLKIPIEGQEDSKIDEMASSQPTTLNIEQNPVLNVPEYGKGFSPNFWMDVVANRMWEVSELFDEDTPNQPIVRAETNETLLNAALLTDEIIAALGNRILGNYSKKAEFQNTLINQRRMLLNAALLAHQDPLNPYMIYCFRNYVYDKSISEKQAESKNHLIETIKKHMSTFKTNDQNLFDKSDLQQALEKSIETSFDRLVERAINYREIYGTGEIASITQAVMPSTFQKCWDSFTTCLSDCVHCCCPCCFTQKSVESSKNKAVIKTNVEKKVATEDVQLQINNYVTRNIYADRKDDKPITNQASLQSGQQPLATSQPNQRPASAGQRVSHAAQVNGALFSRKRGLHEHHSISQGEEDRDISLSMASANSLRST